MIVLYSTTAILESFSHLLSFKNIFELLRKPKSYILLDLGVKAFYGSARESVILCFLSYAGSTILLSVINILQINLLSLF